MPQQWEVQASSGGCCAGSYELGPSLTLLGRSKHLCCEAEESLSWNDQTVSDLLHVNNKYQCYRTALM